MKLKVAILIDWFLPGNKAGGPVKSIYSLIQSLQDKIDFYVITMNTDIASNKVYNIPANQWTKYENINVFYFSKDYFSTKILLKCLNTISPNVLYINSFWSFRFSILPLVLKKINKLNIPIVLAPRGMLEAGSLNIKSFKKKIYLWLSRLLNVYNNIIFHATSDAEKKAIEKFFSTQQVFLIPNFSVVENINVKIEKKKNELKLFFLSRISPIKNLDFALSVLHQLQIPKDAYIEYNLYGNNEDKIYFKQCKERIQTLPPNIKVTYKGILDFHQIPQMIAQHHFLFLPTKNENFGHAIVETLSCGRPVLISNCTPWNDVNTNGCGFALPLNEKLFIQKLQELVDLNNETFQIMCNNAKQFIQSQLNLSTLSQEYIKMFEYASKN